MHLTALLTVRNGEPYLERCLRQFAEQDIDTVVIDHGSTDRTPGILRARRGAPVREVVNVPFEGHLDLEHMLLVQRELVRRLDADWFIRVDVDEILQSDRPGETLRDGIVRAAAAGFDAINFNEFVFVYESDEISYAGTDYVAAMRSYYHFAPKPNRLMRVFRAGLPVDNVASAGHALPLDRIRLYDGNFVMRHYIALSRRQAELKFLTRRFAQKNIARGWHFNRINLVASQFAAPPPAMLQRLERPEDVPDASRPLSIHFWEWPRGG